MEQQLLLNLFLGSWIIPRSSYGVQSKRINGSNESQPLLRVAVATYDCHSWNTFKQLIPTKEKLNSRGNPVPSKHSAKTTHSQSGQARDTSVKDWYILC